MQTLEYQQRLFSRRTASVKRGRSMKRPNGQISVDLEKGLVISRQPTFGEQVQQAIQSGKHKERHSQRCVPYCIGILIESFAFSNRGKTLSGACFSAKSLVHRGWENVSSPLCLSLLGVRAGHFRYFLSFFNNKNDFFALFFQVNNQFLHQSYLKSPLPVKLTW